jgi:hypothetical protein
VGEAVADPLYSYHEVGTDPSIWILTPKSLRTYLPSPRLSEHTSDSSQ